MHVESIETDVLVLGGGISGHRAALAASEQGCHVTMVYLGSGASPFVLAFNVPLGEIDPRDNPEVYFQDTLRGGYNLNERSLVEVLANETSIALREMEAIGVQFARRGDGFAQRHLSGSTYPRSVYQVDGTGRVLLQHMQSRCKELGVQVWSGWKVISLLQDGDDVVGALIIKRNTGELFAIRAKSVVLAMGGIGRIYEDSTYPFDVGADSYALAFQAGAQLMDMEFVQFEPTVVVHPEGAKGMEMPTAMLGDGAPMFNALGERFMFRYNPQHGEKQIEKARMALCIQKEIHEGRGFPDGTVLFDTTSLPRDILEGYKHHCKRLRAAGLEPTVEAPRVRPAAHSHMGGVKIDTDGWTGIPGLYACGETAGGVHGASRLAGNSGSDILVFGRRAGRGAAKGGLELSGRKWDLIQSRALATLSYPLGEHGEASPEEIKGRIRLTMLQCAGLYRDGMGLTKGLKELSKLEEAGLRVRNLKEAVSAVETRHMLLVSRMIMLSALQRTESRGAHQRIDFPSQDETLSQTHGVIHKKPDGSLVWDTIPVG
jgi:succinate dehydrogenase/fumarate reductase flavoprotein subunit